MLKDIFKNKKKEEYINSIFDGYVDIKAYRHEKDGTKKLVYHDTGDNTVTDWMRHIITQLLSGYSFSYSGNKTAAGAIQVTKPNTSIHSTSKNPDSYCLNGEQFLWSGSDITGKEYPTAGNSNYYAEQKELYALFPTKILLGTGCEYTDWATLKEENEETNSEWYTNMVEVYGNGDEATAEINFNNLVGINNDSDKVANYVSNVYSGTVGYQGNYTGNDAIVKAVTVNDPSSLSDTSSSSDMAKRYGVVGAIKTLYDGENGDTYLETSVSDSGRLIKTNFRGCGRPCFIYLTRNQETESEKFDWDEPTADVYVAKDNSSSFLNRITFRIVIPAQSSGTGSIGVYNPFNGYTIKQIGLFNDALFETQSTSSESTTRSNMPCGTMLAIKNVQNFTKTADESIEFTWTLTV